MRLVDFDDSASYFKDKPGCTIINKSKNWWAQAGRFKYAADLF